MSGTSLVSGPVAGQSPYSEAVFVGAQRVAAEHWKEPTVRGLRCGLCGGEWGPTGCPAVFAAVMSVRVQLPIEIEWRAVASAPVPEVAFDFDPDATEVLYFDPAVFDAPRKPRPYPRPSELVGAA